MIICITKNVFNDLNFKSPMSRQDFTYYFPANKLVNDKVCFEKKNIKSFQYIGENLKDDDDIFKLAFQQDKELLRYASQRLRKTNVQS